jgi:mono/diheme cytochrome c family protein
MKNKKRKNIFFDKLKEKPIKLLAIIFPYILIIGIAIGMYYLAKINLIERKTILPALPDSLATSPTDLPLIMPSNQTKADVFALSKPSDSLIAKGKSLFMNNCVSCHGADGKGDGVAAAALNPKPRNFTSNQGWINGPKISEIFKTLSQGIKGSAMVAFDSFSPEDKFALAQFIRSNFVPNPPQDSQDELLDLQKTYNLAEGGHNPGQIPIEDAMVLVYQDGLTKREHILQLLNRISQDSDNYGAKIFKNVTDNKIKALTALGSTDEWKNNEQVFVDIIVNELNDAGFNYKVHRLSNNDWDSFYDYMKKLF